MNSIRISVVCCTCNGEKYLKEQLDSIVEQTKPPYEIIVQDDRSEDGTWNILAEYAEIHKNFKFYKNEIRLGLNQNFLSAFSKATGDFIAVCDQDDVWKENRLETYLKEIESGMYTMVFSDSYITDMELNTKSVAKYRENSIYDMIWNGPEGAPGHSIVFKKEILSYLKNLNEIDFIYDWLLNLTALATGEIKKIDLPLTYWRRHDLTVTDLTYLPPEIKYLSPVRLALNVFGSLLRNKTVKNFKWQFENIYLIIKNFNERSDLKLLGRFLSYYKKESLTGMITSIILYFALRKDLSFKERIKASYSPVYKYYHYKSDGAGLRGL